MEDLEAEEWMKFAELLSKIVNLEMPQTQKASTVSQYCETADLEEFASWFEVTP